MSSPMLPSVEPQTVQAWVASGEAVLIDVREPDEHARERIPGARLVPLSSVGRASLAAASKTVVFHCNSGNRTTRAAAQLSSAADGGKACELAGGLQAWRQAGLPVVVDRKAPLPLMRQVQIGVGSLVLLGTLLAALLSPWLLIIPAFAGAGLLVAGITGFCGMARLLARMPWNRRQSVDAKGASAAAAP